jgi:hypothetical protein
MEVGDQLHAPYTLLPEETFPLLIIQEPKWAPELVLKLWRRKYFAPTENRILTSFSCPSRVLVATWRELYEFE